MQPILEAIRTRRCYFDGGMGSMLGSIAFGGSSLLIVIGVALETYHELEAQMTMRHYKGFLK